MSLDILQAGKHLLIEKPLATNAVDGKHMVDQAKATGTILMVNSMRRYDPGVELAKGLVDRFRISGELGQLTHVRAHRFGNDCSYYDAESWLSTDEPYPEMPARPPSWIPECFGERFRVFNNAYSHHVDLLAHLLGKVSDVEFAEIGEDTSVIVLRFDGFSALMKGDSRSASFLDESVRIYFSDGWLDISLPPPLLLNVSAQVKICQARSEPKVRAFRPPWESSFQRASAHFVDCVGGSKEPRTTGSEALEDLKLMEAVFRKHLRP